jgi:hypothetical protein
LDIYGAQWALLQTFFVVNYGAQFAPLQTISIQLYFIKIYAIINAIGGTIMLFNELKKGSRIHFIGIGGVSMSGIAAILKNWGFLVTGSDFAESENTKKCKLRVIKSTKNQQCNSRGVFISL